MTVQPVRVVSRLELRETRLHYLRQRPVVGIVVIVEHLPAEVLRVGVVVLVDTQEYAVGIALDYLKPVIHVGELLVAYALDSGVVDGDILIAGQHSAEPGKLQELPEVLHHGKVHVLFKDAALRHRAAVKSAVTRV